VSGIRELEQSRTGSAEDRSSEDWSSQGIERSYAVVADGWGRPAPKSPAAWKPITKAAKG